MSNDAPDTGIKLYPSSSAFMEGGLVFTKYSSGCLRHILLRHHGVKDGEIDPIHVERGALNEQLFKAGLGNTPAVDEKPVRFDVSDSPRAYISGRIDFLMYPDDPARKQVRELKSTESSSTCKAVIKDGKVNVQNLAQLVTYMVAEKCLNGELIVTYYKRDKKSKVLKKDVERVFKIDINSDGLIMVDKESSGFYVENLLRHYREAAKAISEHRVADRPYAASPFDSPCAYCPFNSVCGLYDDGVISSTDEFIAVSKQQVSKRSN